MAFFDCLWRGKVESVPTPLLKADPAIPDVGEVVDLASQSKTYVGPKKQKQKASKSRKSNLQGEKVTVVPTQQPKAISDIPVGMDVPALAGPQSKPKIRPDKCKTLTQRILGCFRRGKVESMPTSQIEADPAIPDAGEVVDLADSQSKSVGLKKQKQKASKSRSFHNPWRKKGKSKVKKDADPAIPYAMDGADLAGPQSKPKIRPDKCKTLKQRILGCFQRGKVESMPTSQVEAGPAIPDAGEVVDLADSQSKSVGLKKKKQKASKSRSFHNPWRKKGKSKVKKDADPAIPYAMDGADLASFGGITAANARLQNLGAIPENIGLRGGGNPDPNKAKNPGSKDVGNPEAKALENPRNPLPEDDKVVRPKVINVGQQAFELPSEKKRANRSVPREPFDSKYQLLEDEVLGEGGYGKVYKGIDKSDGTPVAIKRISKQKTHTYLQSPEYPQPVITEVALMLKLGDAPSCTNVIEMYDCYETKHDFILVLEYPLYSESLWDFVRNNRGLSENTARHLMRQAVLAVQHCLDNGVFHTDVHSDNFLVQQSTMSLKLIDFGAGHYLKHEAYRTFNFVGAPCCTPPEIYTAKKFHAMPTNVWALGVLLYFMVLRDFPSNIEKFLSGNLRITEMDLSKEIYDLLKWCLAENPSDRPTLKQILDHDWFKTESNEAELLIYKMSALSMEKMKRMKLND
ncbi:uncharacterized protein [Misgurnus anguillicaudatus]|uniref:uncharacterized protein n=1 Tax=Misgurnus anguillicaudatus TaxID=75329 RepID=UPI003CCF7BB5